ncbi:MAG: aminotransferase class III-fold pyridoxal phosphate-dependent enzyme, partial [Betaproteobacteria bacterium]
MPIIRFSITKGGRLHIDNTGEQDYISDLENCFLQETCMRNVGVPSTLDLEQLDRDSLLHPFTRADDFAAGKVPGQRIVERASGIRVMDAHGRSVIDGMSGMYCVNVGYGRQQIVDAIAQQAAELPYYHIFAGASHPKAIVLADKLLALTGGRMKRVFFGLSGSDANETQIKLVW